MMGWLGRGAWLNKLCSSSSSVSGGGGRGGAFSPPGRGGRGGARSADTQRGRGKKMRQNMNLITTTGNKKYI